MPLEGVRVKEEQNEAEWDAGSLLIDVKQEPDVEDEGENAARAELYVGHQVKREVVIGPELLQMPDSAYGILNTLAPSLDKTYKQERGIKPPMLKDCFVKLDRISTNRLKLSKFDSQPKLNGHKHSHAKDDKTRKNFNQNTYICVTCSKEFTVKRLFIQHLRKHSRPYECKVCNLTFVDNMYLRRHSLLHVVEKKSKTCNNCNEQFATRYALIQHIRHHLGETTCNVCHKKFASVYTLDLHKRLHTGEMPFICDKCGQCFRYKATLINHIQDHDGNPRKKHSCNVCRKQFTIKSNLRAHKRTHTGEKPFHCEICKRTFSAKNNLKKHRLTHVIYMKERRFSCDVCHKTFIRQDNLTKHKLTHNGEKYACGICEKEFGYKENLVYHLKMHSSANQKPHNCEVCGHRFRVKSHLTRHKLIHAGEKPFCCRVCKKCFRHKSTLTTHMRTHTGEKPYACDICAMVFTTISNYYQHKRSVHE